MKTIIMVMAVVGLFGALPVPAAEKCDMKIVGEEGAPQCTLKGESSWPETTGIQGDCAAGSQQTGVELPKIMQKNEKEDIKLLDELCSR